jgi:hypothetical protein
MISPLKYLIFFQACMILEAVFNAVMDTVEDGDHFDHSIFRDWPWFSKSHDAGLKWPWGSPITQLNDGWHFFKMLHYGALLAATILTLHAAFPGQYFHFVLLNILFGFVVIRNSVFEVCFKHLFRRMP